MTVQDLIDELRKFPPTAQVRATWEGTIETISVYSTPNGCVLIDADGDFYRARYESGERSVPGL